MPTYNKLVRDKILEIIEANGQQATHKILEDDEYAEELTKKLFEEVEEYKKRQEHRRAGGHHRGGVRTGEASRLHARAIGANSPRQSAKTRRL